MSLGNLPALSNAQYNALMQQQATQALQNQAFIGGLGSTAGTWGNYFTTSTSTVPTVFVNTSTGIVTYQQAAGTLQGAVASLPANTCGHLKISDGVDSTIELPDGTIINVKADGSYSIQDKDAKVVYRAARMRDFNPFINVSDRLEEFIDFCGKQGVKQGEMLELPINLFIGWLVIQAAKADKEPEPDIQLLPDLRKCKTPRCPSCGRFTLSNMRAKKLEFCAPDCFERYYNKMVPVCSSVPLLCEHA